jgi:hypothetical protein
MGWLWSIPVISDFNVALGGDLVITRGDKLVGFGWIIIGFGA